MHFVEQTTIDLPEDGSYPFVYGSEWQCNSYAEE